MLNFQPELNLAKWRSLLGSSRQTKSDDCPHMTIGELAYRATRWIHRAKLVCKSGQYSEQNMHKQRPPLRSVQQNESNDCVGSLIRGPKVWDQFGHNQRFSMQNEAANRTFSEPAKSFSTLPNLMVRSISTNNNRNMSQLRCDHITLEFFKNNFTTRCEVCYIIILRKNSTFYLEDYRITSSSPFWIPHEQTHFCSQI